MKVEKVWVLLRNKVWLVLVLLLIAMMLTASFVYMRVNRLEEVRKVEEVSQTLSKIEYDLRGVPIGSGKVKLEDRRFVFVVSTGDVLERNFTAVGMNLRAIVFKANVINEDNTEVEDIEVVVWLESSENKGSSVLDPMIDCLVNRDVGGWGLTGTRLDSVFEFKKMFKKGDIWELEFLTTPMEFNEQELSGAAELVKLMSKFDDEYFLRAEKCFEDGFSNGCRMVLPAGLKVYSPYE